MIYEFTSDGQTGAGGFHLYNQSEVNKHTHATRGNVGVSYDQQIDRFPLDEVTHWCGTVNYNAAAADEVNSYSNGDLITPGTSGSAENTGSFANDTMYLGARTNSTLWYDGGIEYFYLFERELSATEIKSVAVDPYQFLIPA